MAEARELAAGRKAEYERRRALRREREQAEKFRERKAAEKIRRVCGVEKRCTSGTTFLDITVQPLAFFFLTKEKYEDDFV